MAASRCQCYEAIFIQNKAFNVNPSAFREILNPYNNIDKTYLHSYDTQMTSA